MSPQLGELTCGYLARMLAPRVESSVARRAIRKMLREYGIARRRGARGWVYTTEEQLRQHAPHVWARLQRAIDLEENGAGYS